MLNFIINVTEKHAKSRHISIQREHVDAYLDGRLASIKLCHEGEVLEEYRGPQLARLLGSAISNGRRTAINQFTGQPDCYFLADR